MRIHNTGRNKPERLGGLPGVPYGEAPVIRPGTQVVLLVGIEIDAPYSTARVLTEKYVVTEMFLALKIRIWAQRIRIWILFNIFGIFMKKKC